MIFYDNSFSGGQRCVGNPDVIQRGSHTSKFGRQVVVPNANINCVVRITGVAVSMNFGGYLSDNLPLFQIWRPISPGLSVYNRVVQVQLSNGSLIGGHRGYYLTNFTVSHPADLQPGDVIGYYQSSTPKRIIWDIENSEYTSYSNNATSPETTIDINNVDYVEANRQPLIELQFGKYIHCNNILFNRKSLV